MYLGEHRARMRAWRQGEVHLLVKEQVVIATTIILRICICINIILFLYQECAVKAVRLERLVGATTSPRSCYLENNLLTFSMFQEQDEQERNGDWWQQRGGRGRRRRRRRRGEDWGEGESEWERSKENHSSHCSHKTLAWSTLWKVMTVRRWRRNL